MAAKIRKRGDILLRLQPSAVGIPFDNRFNDTRMTNTALRQVIIMMGQLDIALELIGNLLVDLNELVALADFNHLPV